jgi:hypothetical protein
MTYAEIVGSLGVALLLLAFLCNLFDVWSPHGLPYILLNVLGAGLACYASVLIGFVPFVILEATWTLVAVVGLVRRWHPVG